MNLRVASFSFPSFKENGVKLFKQVVIEENDLEENARMCLAF